MNQGVVFVALGVTLREPSYTNLGFRSVSEAMLLPQSVLFSVKLGLTMNQSVFVFKDMQTILKMRKIAQRMAVCSLNVFSLQLNS